jgi:hypothetical protein
VRRSAERFTALEAVESSTATARSVDLTELFAVATTATTAAANRGGAARLKDTSDPGDRHSNPVDACD